MKSVKQSGQKAQQLQQSLYCPAKAGETNQTSVAALGIGLTEG